MRIILLTMVAWALLAAASYGQVPSVLSNTPGAARLQDEFFHGADRRIREEAMREQQEARKADRGWPRLVWCRRTVGKMVHRRTNVGKR